MRKLALILTAAALVAGTAFANDVPKKAEPTKTAATKAPVVKTHDVTAEVVSVDVTKKTLTIKGEKENMVVPVLDAKALESLKDVKAGDMLTLTCKDGAKGEHQGVVAVVKTDKAASIK